MLMGELNSLGCQSRPLEFGKLLVVQLIRHFWLADNSDLLTRDYWWGGSKRKVVLEQSGVSTYFFQVHRCLNYLFFVYCEYPFSWTMPLISLSSRSISVCDAS